MGGLGVAFGACGGLVVPLVAAAVTPSVVVSFFLFFFLFLFLGGCVGSGLLVIFDPPLLPGPMVNMVSRTFCQWDLAIPIQFMMENGWLLLSARSQAAWTFSDNLRW